MSHSEKIIAVIPAYNEVRTIGAVVVTLKSYVAEIIVIDDHSVDNTEEEARRSGATIVRNEENKGYDESINIGFAEAARREADIIFTFDADGEHDTSDVSRILAPILAGNADIVAGQRPHTTHVAEKLFALYTGLRYGLHDPLCGLKAYRRNVYDAVGFFDSVSSIGTELMLRGIGKGYRLTLVPVALHTRVSDSSRFYSRRFRANLKIVRALWRILFI